MRALALGLALLFLPSIADSKPRTWLCIGDSITALPGYADAVCDDRRAIGGTTTAFWIYNFPEKTDHFGVVLFLGANDAFRGVDPVQYQENMEVLTGWLRERYRRVVLVTPLRANRSWDFLTKLYRTRVLGICESTSRTRCADARPVVPRFMLFDGVHPDEAGNSIITREVLWAQKRRRKK